MKPQGSHAHEDRLLDFAYGELPASEARVVEQHVQGCSRCSDALEGIRGVRTVMSRLPLQSAPDAGLESLLAYAQQSARRSAAGPEPAPRWWRRLLAPALGVAAMGVFGVVVQQVNRTVDLSPALKQEAAQEQLARQDVPTSKAKDLPAPAEPSPVAAAAAPMPESVQQMNAQYDDQVRKESPKSVRRASKEDWSNASAGSAGGFPEKKTAQLDDEDMRAPVKSKRGGMASAGKSALSVSTEEQRAESARDADDAPADADKSLEAEAPASPPRSQVAQYVPPSPSQRISGSTTRAEPKGSSLSSDEMRSAPGRAQKPTAAPPPPPMAQALPPEPLPAVGGLAEERAAKAEVAQQPREKSAGPTRPVSPAELLRQAEVAHRSGDRAQEAMLLRGALSSGVQGAQRLGVLSRLCEAEFALGRQRSALEICKWVMSEAPGSSEAGMAQRRVESVLQSEADEAKSTKPALTQ
ncbi:anti-sigma factor family protein [Archangium sp.]|jgi:hypothetical protein|uniref:anti-sigma factor family protein n=1 Tax=Archangium sp. TaxID=1872627 RepID=UPI002ED839D9